jgi:hypothetical protein
MHAEGGFLKSLKRRHENYVYEVPHSKEVKNSFA